MNLNEVSASVLSPLPFETTEPVRAAFAAIGRTEDLRFSPNNRLLILADYGRHRLVVFGIRIEPAGERPCVVLDDYMEVTSPALKRPHGIDFIDNETIAVANRRGLVTLFPLPPAPFGGREYELQPLSEVAGKRFKRVTRPGSLAVTREAGGRVGLLVCNNYTHKVTRHMIDPAAGFGVVGDEWLLRRGLKIPDGITVSHDGQWVAVSSHGTHDVKLFPLTMPLRWHTGASGSMRGGDYPHGLRFTADDSQLLVADAGAPVIHVYDRGAGWGAKRNPTRSIQVIDDESFKRGRINKEEGGPKGIDIDGTNSVVAVTCEEQPLLFFALRSLTHGE